MTSAARRRATLRLDGRSLRAVVDVDPQSATYGTILHTTPTGSAANEAHHFGYTVDADRIFAGGILTNRVFIYDVKTDPRKPKLLRTVNLDETGYSGPHSIYAVPGGVMVAMLGKVGGGGPGAALGNSVWYWEDADSDGQLEFHRVLHLDGGAWLIHVGPEGMRVDESFAPDFMNLASGPAGPHDMLLK